MILPDFIQINILQWFAIYLHLIEDTLIKLFNSNQLTTISKRMAYLSLETLYMHKKLEIVILFLNLHPKVN